MYQSAQVYFSLLFYSRIFPGANELWLFALVMLWEYFSMLYVRSLSSIRIFPRCCLFSFLLYHFYIYSYPSGFHSLALMLAFIFTCWSMCYCLQKFELPAYNRGDVSSDRPRALVNHLPWPSWAAALPPEFSIFQPLSERTINIYQADVPPLRQEGREEGEGEPRQAEELQGQTLAGRLRGMVTTLFGSRGAYERINPDAAAAGEQGRHRQGADVEAGGS